MNDEPPGLHVHRSSFIVHRSMKSIPKIGAVKARVTAPPSKSYSVRALLLAAMAEGETRIDNCLDSDDTRYALEALRTIGFSIAGTFARGVTIGLPLSL